MTGIVVVLGAALGLALALSGTPPLRTRTLARRVEPYLRRMPVPSRGPAPRPSRAQIERWLERRWPRRFEVPRERLQAAGFARSVWEFRVEQAAWGGAAAAGALGISLAAAGAGAAVDARTVPVLVGVALVTGVFARDWWLSQQVARRRREIADQLPVALDLVTLSITAGESVPAAFARVAAVLAGGIGDEMGRVVGDVRAGTPVLDALEAMKHRFPDYRIVRFVDALCTGIERGAPLAEVLRAQAEDARAARRRELLELGGRREVLMMVPVVFLILPVVVAIALLPGLVSLELLVP